MSGNLGRAPEDWRNYSAKVPLAAMVIHKGDLKKLYKIINDKQIEFRDRFMSVLALQPNETEEKFEARKNRVRDSFVTSMVIDGQNGEKLHGNNESFLDEANLPDQIRSVYFDTGSAPRAVTGIAPLSKIVVFLDFTRPPFFDFSRLPTLPTPNGSNFDISSDNESWFSAAKSRLSDFFNERQTKVNWLHRAATYDILLSFVGLPIAIWAVYRVSVALEKTPQQPNILISAIYVYSFFLCLTCFRLFFMYSRWVFPKVELASERSPPLRHRKTWLAILAALLVSLLISLLGAAISDVVKWIFTHL
jgi:hypothetical protein